MSKLIATTFAALLGAGALAVTAVPVPAAAALLGPDAAACATGKPAVIVSVTGFKKRSGKVRVQLYRSATNYLDKGSYLERIDVAVPATGDASVCVPVPKAGRYVVSVRHDLNGNGKSDMKDGGGFSGNPDVKLSDVIGKRKPSLTETSFAVGSSPARVRVVLSYLRGLSFQPVG